MARNQSDNRRSSLYGSVDLLILRVIDVDGPLHGWEITRLIETLSEGALLLEEGALYPALHRLERKKLLQGEWRVSDKGRRARFYDLTPAGRRALQAEIEQWANHTAAMEKVLALPEGNA